MVVFSFISISSGSGSGSGFDVGCCGAGFGDGVLGGCLGPELLVSLSVGVISEVVAFLSVVVYCDLVSGGVEVFGFVLSFGCS